MYLKYRIWPSLYDAKNANICHIVGTTGKYLILLKIYIVNPQYCPCCFPKFRQTAFQQPSCCLHKTRVKALVKDQKKSRQYTHTSHEISELDLHIMVGWYGLNEFSEQHKDFFFLPWCSVSSHLCDSMETQTYGGRRWWDRPLCSQPYCRKRVVQTGHTDMDLLWSEKAMKNEGITVPLCSTHVLGHRWSRVHLTVDRWQPWYGDIARVVNST